MEALRARDFLLTLEVFAQRPNTARDLRCGKPLALAQSSRRFDASKRTIALIEMAKIGRLGALDILFDTIQQLLHFRRSELTQRLDPGRLSQNRLAEQVL